MGIKKFNDFTKVNEEEGMDVSDFTGFDRNDTDKKFMAFWHGKVFELNDEFEVMSKGIADFTEDLGYSEGEIQALDNLEVASTWTSEDYGNDHIVTRVK